MLAILGGRKNICAFQKKARFLPQLNCAIRAVQGFAFLLAVLDTVLCQFSNNCWCSYSSTENTNLFQIFFFMGTLFPSALFQQL